ncbi:hypothetical protein MKZ38_005476 [Zalerion maritima]|uniref:Uncharacterized protein n=1 Tax=Zalerion maritima TaxID=339359 RepID=A0AAD5WNY4_9PEZI|nr:hypothetical protein MKZ38_005476 [Zalerion maritima]
MFDMVLLSAAHVQVAISSGIVLVFTTFLFLSGVVIQHRTLTELRIAVKPTPRPSPKTDLPDSYALPWQFKTEEDDKVWFDQWGRRHGGNVNVGGGGKKDVVVEVLPSVPENKVGKGKGKGKGRGKTSKKGIKGHGRGMNEARKEGNRKIGKDEKVAEEEDDRNKGGEGKGEEEETPTERRRRIQRELRELSQGGTPVYYQRRLW